MTNLSANWLLAVYLDENASPGVIPDPKTAQESMARMRERARSEARRRGVTDENLAEEAVSAMLAWVAGSRISERVRIECGIPQRYINTVISRFVQREIGNRWRTRFHALSDELSSHCVDPATEVEIRDLAQECLRRLGPDFGRYVEKGPPDEPPGRRDVRRHRHRERQWKTIADLFDERQSRAQKRQSAWA